MDGPERIEVAGGRVVRLQWPDGLDQEIPVGLLRKACACADCREVHGAGRIRLQVVDPTPPTIDDARLVGGYGINFVFGPDGHRTGIFTWRQLRELQEDRRGTA
ncbi:MAG: DUF971 domain-containing protein [Acidimicrobiia bacterium]